MDNFKDFITEDNEGLTLSKAIKHYKANGWTHHKTLKAWRSEGGDRGSRSGGSFHLNSVSKRDKDGRPIKHHLKQDSRGVVKVTDEKTQKDTKHTSVNTLKV